MRSWLTTLLALDCCFLIAGSIATESKTLREGLLFEQTGRTNGSIYPFSVAVGWAAESKQGIIFVPLETYESISAVVARASDAPPQQSLLPWTFQVTSFKGGMQDEKYIVHSEEIAMVVGILRKMFLRCHEPVPEWLVALETMTKARR